MKNIFTKTLTIAALALLASTTLHADHLKGCTLVCDANSNYKSESDRQCSTSRVEDPLFQIEGCEIDSYGKYIGEIPDGNPTFKVPSRNEIYMFLKQQAVDFGTKLPSEKDVEEFYEFRQDLNELQAQNDTDSVDPDEESDDAYYAYYPEDMHVPGGQDTIQRTVVSSYNIASK